jgi:hypothetical protein
VRNAEYRSPETESPTNTVVHVHISNLTTMTQCSYARYSVPGYPGCLGALGGHTTETCISGHTKMFHEGRVQASENWPRCVD